MLVRKHAREICSQLSCVQVDEFELIRLKPWMQTSLWFAVYKRTSITCCTRGYSHPTVHVDSTICVHHITHYVYTSKTFIYSCVLKF
ncbi:unnamed protein product [Brassica oleracea var. botrytis]|uniref:Uncharacterized protein n=2 Tax=Brassica oleracea TaxID=3712 RepID=A0A0D3A8E7_BRAOL|nr:unnamed protein product [Brassica oleracea]